MRLCLQLLPLVGVAIFVVPPVASQSPAIWRSPTPLPRNVDRAPILTTGQMLEYNFGVAFRSCGYGRFVEHYGLFGRRQLSRIPQVLQLNLPLTDSIRRLRASSLSRALSYVAPQGTTDPAMEATPIPTRQLRIDPALPPGLMIPLGEQRLVYTNSCGTTVKMSSDLKLHVTPVADAAFAAMRQSATNQSVTLAAGRFISPLTAMLDSAGAEGFYARQLVWDWYMRNAPAVKNSSTSGGVFRAQVNGIVLSRSLTQQLESSMKASAEGNAPPLTFATLTASAQTNLVHAQSVAIQRYEIWEFPISPTEQSSQIATLPTPNELNTEMVRRMEAVLKMPSGEDVVQSIPWVHTQVIDGFSPAICTDAAWTLGGPSAATLRRSISRDPTPVPAANPWIRCAVTVTFEPPESFWNAPHARDWALDYTLISTAGRGVDTAQITLPFSVHVHLIDSPVVRQFRPAGDWNRVDPDEVMPSTITWTGYELRVTDDSRSRIQWVNFSPASVHAEIICPSASDGAAEERVPLALVGTPLHDANNDVLSIQFRAAFPAGATLDRGNARKCVVGGTVSFTTGQAGVTVTKTLPAQSPISYPGRPPTQDQNNRSE